AGAGQRFGPLLFGGVLTGLTWFAYFNSGFSDLTAPVLISLVFLIVAVYTLIQGRLMAGRVVLRALRRQLQDEWSKKLYGWRRLSITPESITLTSKLTTNSALWRAVEQIAVTEDHAFFLFTKSYGFVLPVRAFADEEEFTEFVKTTRR